MRHFGIETRKSRLLQEEEKALIEKQNKRSVLSWQCPCGALFEVVGPRDYMPGETEFSLAHDGYQSRILLHQMHCSVWNGDEK